MLAATPVELIKQHLCNAEWALKLQRDAIVKVFESMDDPYIATRRDDVNHVFNRVMQALVVGLNEARRYLKPGEPLVIDGENGMVIADPDENTIVHFHKRQRELKRKARELVKLTDTKPRAKSGEKITLLANIEIDDDLKSLRKVNAAGFVPQLRAILRASAKAPIKIMFPMLTTITELQQAIHLLQATKESLRVKGIKFDEKIAVGGMIEVPAAAISATHFAKHLDFLSIGTNDLIQYTLAIDRIDDQVNYLYDPLNPAVLALIKMVIDAGQKQKIPVTMCGEMAGNKEYTRLLLGLGLRDFSMPPNSILEIKSVLRSTNIGSIRRRALALLHCSGGDHRES